MSINSNDAIVQVSLEEVEHNLPVYLRRAEAGESFVIIKSGKPVAEIKPPSSKTDDLRPYGLCEGEFVVPDDFDEPLPDEILRSFEGS